MATALKDLLRSLICTPALLGCVSLAGCSFFAREPAPKQDPQSWTSLLDGATSLDLKTVSRDKIKGKIVFINFWASWCPPCQEEMPGLFKLARRYSGKVAVIAISQDANLKDAKKWIDLFPKSPEATLYLLSDEKHLWERMFNVSKLPETFIFDANGKLLLKLAGSVDFEGPEIQNIISTKTD